MFLLHIKLRPHDTETRPQWLAVTFKVTMTVAGLFNSVGANPRDLKLEPGQRLGKLLFVGSLVMSSPLGC